jgi:hypothetical protein
MTFVTTAAVAADEDQCAPIIQELSLLLQDATQDSGRLRAELGRAVAMNNQAPCACRRLPMTIAIVLEVLDPGGDSAAKVHFFRLQASDCDPAARLAFAELRFTALDRRAKRHLRGLSLAERILGQRYEVAAWWAGMYLDLERET